MTSEDGDSLSSAYYHATNRGKRSVALELDSEAGQSAVRALAERSDVVIENFKVGGLAKYGLDYEGLREINPCLVYCSITGFGQTGPYAARAGYDFLIQGMGGLMSVTGEAEGEPLKVGVAIADITTGLYASNAILAALRRRDRTGEGAHIDMALLDCQVALLCNQAMNYLVSGRPPMRLGNAHPNVVPYQVFPAADGHLTALLTAFERHGIPAGPINDVGEVFADPQVMARGLHTNLRSGETTIPTVACPIVMDGERMVAAKASPRLGEDREAVLSELGLASTEGP